MNSPVNISGNTQPTSNRGGIGGMSMGQVKGGVIDGNGTTDNMSTGIVIKAGVSAVSGTTIESGKTRDHVSAVQTSTANLLSQVSDFLPDGERLSAGERAGEFQIMMENFVSEVEKVREGFGYGYEREDYIQRLSVSDDEFERVFERILGENISLHEGYMRLLENYTGDREKFKKRLTKEYGVDLVYEGISEGECGNENIGRLKLENKTVKEVKEMVVGFASVGGKRLDICWNNLGKVFAGQPEKIKEMVVGFARKGGKRLDISYNDLDKVFAGQPEMFKETVVGFASNGGKSIDVYSNYISEVFAGQPEMLKEMVVGFAREGGKRLDTRNNFISLVFAKNPTLIEEILSECKKYGTIVFPKKFQILVLKI